MANVPLIGVNLGGQDGTALLTSASSIQSSGDQSLVDAVTGEVVRLFRAVFVSSGDVTLELRDGDGGTIILGPFIMSTGQQVTLAFDTNAWCETSPGNALVANLSAGSIPVALMIGYTQG